MSKKTPTPQQIDRERQVMEMRRAGATFDDIARTLEFANASGAWQAYNRAFKRTLIDAGVEEMRELELDRLDRMQRAVWARVLQGDDKAINTALKILDRRAKYLGLDAPTRQEVKLDIADTNSIDAEVARLVEMLATNDK